MIGEPLGGVAPLDLETVRARRPEGSGPRCAAAEPRGDAARVARGLASVVLAQLLTTPLSVAVAAVLARRFGPSDFGALYLASSAAGLAFLFVEWGQGPAVAAEIARDRSSSGVLLGTSVVVKLVLAVAATALLLILGSGLGYAPQARTALAFVCAQSALASIQASAVAVLRGLERTERVAMLSTATALLGSLLTIATALAGFGLVGVLWAMVIAAAVALVPAALLLRVSGALAPSFDLARARTLLTGGSGFLVFSLVLALQGYVDANFLARLAPQEVMGWHAAARRMGEFLVFPTTSLSFVMYPTLVRLHHESGAALAAMVRGSLRLVLLAAAPACVGTVLFAAPVVALVYGPNYAGAALTLQVLAPWILLVYVSVQLGIALLATGRVVAWTVAQALTVGISLVASPLLIRVFEDRLGNGAVGVAVSSVLAEAVVLAIGLALAPRPFLDGIGGALVKSAAGAVAMAAVGRALWAAPLAVGIAGSLGAYLVTVMAVRGLTPGDVRELVRALRPPRAPPAVAVVDGAGPGGGSTT